MNMFWEGFRSIHSKHSLSIQRDGGQHPRLPPSSPKGLCSTSFSLLLDTYLTIKSRKSCGVMACVPFRVFDLCIVSGSIPTMTSIFFVIDKHVIFDVILNFPDKPLF